MLVISRRPSRLLGIRTNIILVTREFSSVLEDVLASVSPASLAALAVLAAADAHVVPDVPDVVVAVVVAAVAGADAAGADISESVNAYKKFVIIYEEPLQESMQGLFISS